MHFPQVPSLMMSGQWVASFTEVCLQREAMPGGRSTICRGCTEEACGEGLFMGVTEDNQEVIMNCIRCGGFQMLDQFYGMENNGSVWMYDAVRCLNCGSIKEPMREKGEAIPSVRAERINQYGLSVRTVGAK